MKEEIVGEKSLRKKERDGFVVCGFTLKHHPQNR